ncbi:MAG: MGMT family protein [Candidatus Absconditicoccaceae bacterium]
MDIKLQIYKFLQTIPHGKVVSYKTIADKFDIHPRYVGKIMNQNQNPDIYPCYKVIRSDGNLGGYGGGCEEKIKRLKSDGIQIIDSKIGKTYFRKD